MSDIHFRDGENAVESRAGQIAYAITSVEAAVDACFIVLSGDIAQSGKPPEYSRARDFLERIRQALRAERGGLDVSFVVVPGNHDVDKDRFNEARDVLVANALIYPDKLLGQSILAPCVAPQEAFFEFAADVCGKVHALQDKLFVRHAFCVGDKWITFNCYNTAWCSYVPERTGKSLPTAAFVDDGVAYDFAVSVMHHPLSWFAPEAAHSLRGHLDASSDLVLTGHEHESLLFDKAVATGERTRYSEAAVLQEHGRDRSGFAMFSIDLKERLRRRTEFAWVDGLYKPHTTEWESYERGAKLARDRFEVSAQFARFLMDNGTPFTHPAKASVTVEDIYVDLELDPLPALRSHAEARSITTDNLSELLGSGRAVVVAPELSGKTTSAKVLYRRLLQKGTIPTFIRGSDISSVAESVVDGVIRSAIEQQYGASHVDRYLQLPCTRRALIIDDFDDAPLNPKGRSRALHALCARCDTVVLFVSDVYWIDQVVTDGDAETDLLQFLAWELRELGNHRRGLLLERWYTIGREYDIEEQNLSAQIASSQKLIRTLRGRNLFPTTPLNVLTIVQAEQSQRDLSTLNGSHGYAYEALIAARLAAWPSNIPRDAVATLLSMIAYDCYRRGELIFSDDQFSRYVRAYYDEYTVRLPSEQLRAELLKCLMIERCGGGYRFKYPFVYYYFVARYFQRHLADRAAEGELRADIRAMTHALYVSENANILIFLVYLTQDAQTIEEMLAYAKTLFAEHEPCDLDSHLDFLSRAADSPISYELPSTKPRQNWHSDQKQLDLIDREDVGDDRLEPSDDLLQLNAATKALQVLGQVLRGFTGSLPGATKVRITRECYLLGLRTLMATVSGVRQNIDDLRNAFVNAQRDEQPDKSEAELRLDADRFVVMLFTFLTEALLRRLTFAVGYEHLVDIYREVLDTFAPPTIAIELVDYAVHLENFLSIDVQRLLKFYQRIENRIITSNLLRTFVFDYLRCFPVDFKTRQLLADKLSFKVNDPRIVSGK